MSLETLESVAEKAGAGSQFHAELLFLRLEKLFRSLDESFIDNIIRCATAAKEQRKRDQSLMLNGDGPPIRVYLSNGHFTPEFLQWATSQDNEKDIGAEYQKLLETGGSGIEDLIAELEAEAKPSYSLVSSD